MLAQPMGSTLDAVQLFESMSDFMVRRQTKSSTRNRAKGAMVENMALILDKRDTMERMMFNRKDGTSGNHNSGIVLQEEANPQRIDSWRTLFLVKLRQMNLPGRPLRNIPRQDHRLPPWRAPKVYALRRLCHQTPQARKTQKLYLDKCQRRSLDLLLRCLMALGTRNTINMVVISRRQSLQDRQEDQDRIAEGTGHMSSGCHPNIIDT